MALLLCRDDVVQLVPTTWCPIDLALSEQQAIIAELTLVVATVPGADPFASLRNMPASLGWRFVEVTVPRA